MRNIIIFLGFDGVVLEDESPKFGRENFGCLSLVKKLQERGHTVVLNTSRIENKHGFKKAMHYINFHHRVNLKPISPTPSRYTPLPFLDSEGKVLLHKNGDSSHHIFIDDKQEGIPLKDCIKTSGRMVDFDTVEKFLIKAEIL